MPAYFASATPFGLKAEPGEVATATALPGVVLVVVTPQVWLGFPVAGPVGLLGECGLAPNTAPDEGSNTQLAIARENMTCFIFESFRAEMS